jgi:transposase
MYISTVGIDLAKIFFQIHGVDAQGKMVLRKKLDRSKMTEFFSSWRRA